MNTSTGIVPTMPINNDGFGGDGGFWIFGLLILLGLMNGGFNGRNGEYATQGQVASQGTQNMLFDVNNNMNNGFQNTNSNLFNGFERTNANIYDIRQAVYGTGAGLSNQVLNSRYELGTQILENKYANQLAEGQTQRDVLMQTTQLSAQAGINALEAQAHIDSCCCDIKSLIREDGEKTRALITDNLISDLRTQLTDQKNINSDLMSVNATINAIRPYPVPSYAVSSPYTGLNAYAYGYGNGFYGNAVI